MKRIEEVADVYEAMDFDINFHEYVMRIHEEDVENDKRCKRNLADFYLKSIRGDMADAMDGNSTLWAMHLSLKHILTKCEDAVEDCASCGVSLDESIEHWLDPQWSAFQNVIIDNGKVYWLNEIYAEKDDTTFIMRYPFFGVTDWADVDESIDVPNRTCVGWYAGNPCEDATSEFYGNLGAEC